MTRSSRPTSSAVGLRWKAAFKRGVNRATSCHHPPKHLECVIAPPDEFCAAPQRHLFECSAGQTLGCHLIRHSVGEVGKVQREAAPFFDALLELTTVVELELFSATEVPLRTTCT